MYCISLIESGFDETAGLFYTLAIKPKDNLSVIIRLQNLFFVFFILVASLPLLFATSAKGQLPLDYEMETQFIGATEGQLPFWLHANRFGVVDGSSANGLLRGAVEKPFERTGRFGWSTGLEVVGRASEHSAAYLNQAYGKLRYGAFELHGGRERRRIGMYQSELTSGPFQWSGNTTPMPQIRFGIPEFTPVPWTDGYLQVKGWMSHGWFEDDRWVRDAYLHQKAGYIKVVFPYVPVKGFAGLLHSAQWGGTSRDRGHLPSGASDLVDVFFGRGGDDTAPKSDQLNALGNHLGIWEVGGWFDLGTWQLFVQKTFPFEDGSGLALRSPEDGLWGATLYREDQHPVSTILYEFYYTKSQSGPGPSDPPPGWDKPNDSRGNPFGGRDNYFNNGIYADDWSYNGRIIGSPFFTYVDGAADQSGSVINNRFIAHHLAVEGHLSTPSLDYKAAYSFTRNYGTYQGYDTSIDPPKTQHSVYLDLQTPLPYNRNITLKTRLAADTGELFPDNLGIMAGVEWKF